MSEPLAFGSISEKSPYVYLGAIFTADGSLSSSLKGHVNAKQKHFNNLVMFLNTNTDMLFVAERKVVEAAFNSATLYGCVCWLDTGLQAMDKLYTGALKYLLGVRSITANDLWCNAE